jgi:hypothetical protein
MVDIVQVDKCMIKPSAQLCAIDIIDGQMEDRLQQLARECYFFEASCQAEPSWLISQLVERCVTCTEPAQQPTCMAPSEDREGEMERLLSSLS